MRTGALGAQAAVLEKGKAVVRASVRLVRGEGPSWCVSPHTHPITTKLPREGTEHLAPPTARQTKPVLRQC